MFKMFKGKTMRKNIDIPDEIVKDLKKMAIYEALS